MFTNPKTVAGIDASRKSAVEKEKRDAYSKLHGSTPEDVHSKAFESAKKKGMDDVVCHRVAAAAVQAAAEKKEEK